MALTDKQNTDLPVTKGNMDTTIASQAEDIDANLSDFSLFLTVMKNPKAYRNTLSIILAEPDIQLKEVKVEQVILNKTGKRAIRLDAWAESTDNRQFDMEMQNDTDQDYIPKRSRFYQGLMDSPVLKSGKKTKYRQLPSSTIIFITQDDIFKKDLAKYTFFEQCEEIKGLKLDDGTTKIFLNMTSKNGSKELVSLLQYMKKTNINNPEITVKDERLLELDKVVTEVRESEEWEAVRMDILDVGIKRGQTQGEYKKLISQIEKKKSKGCTIQEIADIFEEDISLVEKIYNALDQYDASTDWMKILSQLN
ncbi:MAG: Rpn family recombination-promoting nuclease/putative transposase [Suilimivivens sp.]